MRIAVVNNFYPPRAGGSAHLSESLAKGYAAAGHEVLVITAQHVEAPSDHEVDGIRIVRMRAFKMPNTRLAVNFDIPFTTRPLLFRRLRRLLDSFQPDVIHQHGQFFDLTWWSGRWARKRNVPALLSVHTRLESPRRLYRIAFAILDRFMVAPLLRPFKPTFVVMDVQMDGYIRRKYRRAIRDTVAIPVGVDPAWVRGGDGSVVRERHGLGDAPVILSTGHVIPLRDRLALVEAMPAVLAAVPEAKLLVVGGVYFDAFLRRAAELGVADSVITTGAVPKSDIPHYLAAASVESHDLQGYGFGTASLESMAAGVPVIAAVREDNFLDIKLLDREVVHLVPQGDSKALAARLVEVLTDPDSARHLADAGMALVDKHFTLDAVLARHLAVLADLAAAKAGKP
jgi:glycosyltransferase involved in cell wall biosynthesis